MVVREDDQRMYRHFESLVDPFAAGDDRPPPSTIWSFLKSHIHPFRHLLPLMVLLGLCKALLECGLIFYAGRLIDLMTETGVAAFWDTHKVELVIALFVVLMFRPVLIWVHHLFLDQAVASNLQEQVRWQAHRHMLGQSMSFFQRELAGKLSNRVMQLGQAVEEIFHSTFEALWFGLVYAVSAVILLGQIDWRLGLPLAIWILAYILYVRYKTVRIAHASKNWSNARSAVSGAVVDAYSNIETVKLFADTSTEQDHFLPEMRLLRHRAQRFRREMTDLSLGMNLLNGAMIAGVVGPAVWLWMQGSVTVGQVSAATALTIRLNGMTGWLMFVATRIFENVGIIKDGLATISVPHELTDLETAAPRRIRRGEIAFKQVSHGHGGAKGCLQEIDLHIPGGQKIGLVGHSGAGKSTLIRLLLRLQRPNHGSIQVDGQCIESMTQASLRSQISVVAQDPSFLHRSIRTNLLYGSPDATEADMIRAARLAEAHDFIQKLSGSDGHSGYDAHIGERGVTLSGGQRQRLAIARAILKDAPILVLDEATSALDSVLEAKILRNLQQITRGKTVIAIAHRLSTLAQFDRIVVLDRGRIVEDGPHSELIRKGGIYAAMWQQQRAEPDMIEG
ncbi:ABC transporter ATP-binding protein [Pseudoruegeria sp. HB172150]|uniref:ABC transporter ATP-binding protein n=1 Tax=Pseudoruegeria sp. HB172150 TaxID=2721164 RepID=UPI0020A63710|nr:ABC transporter ATP-binding protein [Pseudoruegeria sp. HB172150]